eukprot:gene19547-34203_t
MFSSDEEGVAPAGPATRRRTRKSTKAASASEPGSTRTAPPEATATTAPSEKKVDGGGTFASITAAPATSRAALMSFAAGCYLRWLWFTSNGEKDPPPALVQAKLMLEMMSIVCSFVGLMLLIPGERRDSIFTALGERNATVLCKTSVAVAVFCGWFYFQNVVASIAPGVAVPTAEVAAIVCAILLLCLLLPSVLQDVLSDLLAALNLVQPKSASGRVTSLLRYPVKGLDFTGQPLAENVTSSLAPGCGLLHDRHWALNKGEDAVTASGHAPFDPSNPTQWVHKMRFAAACSEGLKLAQLRGEWQEEDELLLAAKLDTKTGRAKATKFFRKWLGDPELEMVTAGPCASETWAKGQPRMHVANQESARLIEVDAAARHQFSNTKQVEGNQMIHIVNMNTVAAISKAFGGDDIGWQRFRPNVLITDCPAWSEFEWVGKTIHLGTATVKVTKRTVRCDATKVNPKTAVADLDVPALLSKHFPQHGPYVGVYAIVVTAGNVTAGDVVGF